MAVWCKVNNLSLNVSKTKEMIVDYKRKRGEHASIHIDRAVMERVESFKFLGIHITKDLTWSTHTDTVVKRERQRLFPLRRLIRFSMGAQISKFYSCTIKSILNCSALDPQNATKGTSLGPSSLPSRTSISGGVRGRLEKLPKTPATQAIDCSLYYRSANCTGASAHGPTGSETASTPKP